MIRNKFRGIQGADINLDDLFPTGFTIELSCGQYFKRWKNRSIHCSILNGAKYFPSMKAAEEYIYQSLCFVGLDPYICKVGWILMNIEDDMYRGRDGYTPNSWEANWFLSYSEASRFQEQQSLRETSIIEYHSYRVKKVVLAA